MDVHGEHMRCFVVVTREAHDAGAEVHDRMSAFLTPQAMDVWCAPEKLDRGGREDMLAIPGGSSAAIAATIEQNIIDRKVNDSRTVDLIGRRRIVSAR